MGRLPRNTPYRHRICPYFMGLLPQNHPISACDMPIITPYLILAFPHPSLHLGSGRQYGQITPNYPISAYDMPIFCPKLPHIGHPRTADVGCRQHYGHIYPKITPNYPISVRCDCIDTSKSMRRRVRVPEMDRLPQNMP